MRNSNAASKILLGYANSIFQSSGPRVCKPSNWSDAADKHPKKIPQAGESIQHWDNFENDIKIMAEQGCNSYRFSIEWSAIEPEQGVFDDDVMQAYIERFKICEKYGIEPMVTLLHFTEPLWFTKLNGFEEEYNLLYFTRYARKVFAKFHPYVNKWCTINEPAVQAFQGYLHGEFPPFAHRPQRALNLLTNLLKAHVKTYTTLKAEPGGHEAQIGIVHNVLKFIPKPQPTWFKNKVTTFLASYLSEFGNNIVMKFLKTGSICLDWWTASKKYQDDTAPSSFDFVGLNFYGNAVLGFNAKGLPDADCFEGQVLSDMFVPCDPKGFAEAIDDVAKLGKPIYITETGIADNDLDNNKDDTRRQNLLKEYLAVFQQKVAEGVNILGLYWWTFVGNYEWNQGYTKDFGLFGKNRQPRKSTSIFTDFLQLFKRKREEEAAESSISLSRPVFTAA
jgi:beta-glucosidase